MESLERSKQCREALLNMQKYPRCAGADPPVPSFLRECISAEVPIYRDFRCFCGSRWQNASDLYNSCFCDMIGFIKMQHIRR